MASKKKIRTDFTRLYGKEIPDLDLNSQEFRFFLTGTDLESDTLHTASTSRGSGTRAKTETIEITDLLETVEWRDEGNALNLNTIPILSGTITYHTTPQELPGPRLHIRDGHRIRADVKWLGEWKPLWEMRVFTPPEHTSEDGTATAELWDDLKLATLSIADFRYRKGKTRRRKGWTYDQIVQDVCKRYRIPVGGLVNGTSRINNLSQTDTFPLDIIRQAVNHEQDWTGRRLLICWRFDDRTQRFALHVIHAQRNPILYRFENEIRNATTSPTRRARLATATVARGSGKKKGGKRKKYTVRMESTAAVARYGYIRNKINVPGNSESRAEVTRYAKASLAKNLKAVRIISNFQTTGIAFVRRGDTIDVVLPQEGFIGEAGFVFVTSVTHSLSAGDYTMTMELNWRDPFDPNIIKKERETAARARKRSKRGKKS